MAFSKIDLKTYNALFIKNNIDLALSCLDNNPRIYNFAIDILIQRNPLEIDLPDDILYKIIDKMNYEQIWYLANYNRESYFCYLAFNKLQAIFDLYDPKLFLYK